jgi:DNA gyrase subunit A
MGRATSGVKGMGLRTGDEVIAAGIADDELDMLVVTEQGYGKRTRMSDYPVKGRGGLGVKTVQLTEARGQLAGALAVREGYQVMLISNGGTVIRMPVDEIKRLGRSTQGVIVMRLRGDEEVSSIALVAESEPEVEEPAAADAVAPAAESDKND